MPRYKSRLEAVLKHRLHLEKEAQVEFVHAQNRLLEEEGKQKQLKQDMEKTLNRLSTGQGQGMLADEMGVYYSFIKRQNERIEESQQAIALLSDQCEEKRARLFETMRDRKAIDKVEAVRKEAFLKEQNKKEQDILDEIGGRQHWKPPRRNER